MRLAFANLSIHLSKIIRKTKNLMDKEHKLELEREKETGPTPIADEGRRKGPRRGPPTLARPPAPLPQAGEGWPALDRESRHIARACYGGESRRRR